MTSGWAVLLAGVLGIVGTALGSTLTGRTTRKLADQTAAHARAERNEERTNRLHEDVTTWALIEYNWATAVAAGIHERPPYDAFPGRAEHIAARVRIGESDVVRRAYERFHRAVLEVRASVDFSSLIEPSGIESELELDAGTPQGVAGLKVVETYIALINAIRSDRELTPLERGEDEIGGGSD